MKPEEQQMTKRTNTAHAVKHAVKKNSQDSTEREKQERKQRVLTQGTPSVVGSIADAVVVKNENLFFLAKADGRVPSAGDHGFGLYYHDCRFLNGYELKVADAYPNSLVSTAAQGYMAAFQLTNPDIRMADGRLIHKEEIGIKWERILDAGRLALDERITVENFGPRPVEFGISLSFSAGFEDVFAIRGLLPEKPGQSHDPDWQDDVLSFRYDGADGIHRGLSVHFSPAPEATDGATAHFQIRLRPEERRQFSVSLVVAESSKAGGIQPKEHRPPKFEETKRALQHSCDQWMADRTETRSDSTLLNAVLDRSFRDLHALRSRLEDQEYFAAGLPWFGTLFGRDSLITALQTLAFDPEIAAHTLRLLADFQCRQVDDWRDGQPGKILHELRVGELARTGEIPHTPYYGTVDATPLFLILIGRHAAWTGDLTLFHELRSNIELALEWMAKYGDLNGDGYVAYASSSEKGLINQGWKDSGDAIVDADGNLAQPPIALAEVQGYVFLAKVALAELYQRAEEREKANQLRQEAERLRARFNRDFWLEEKGTYALALQADHRPAAVVSSNAGQVLWGGIADPDKAQRTMECLMGEEMFSGWGVRTLSEKERRYNPVGYHLGTVWPHDNSIIAAGFRKYGFDDAARRIFAGILEAAMHFEHYRLPEVFSGFRRGEFGVPVRYPVACHPQAWAAGAIPYLVETALGLVPEAFERRLRIVRPTLPEDIERIEVRRLKVGRAQTDLNFRRADDGTIVVEVLNVEGPLDVISPES